MVKKKNKEKWHKAHEFQRKKSTRRQVGHPSYIYAKRGRDYKYLTFTYTPENEDDYVKLKHNIDPDEKEEPTYMKKWHNVAPYDAFQAPDKKYRIHQDDRETVKQYKNIKNKKGNGPQICALPRVCIAEGPTVSKKYYIRFSGICQPPKIKFPNVWKFGRKERMKFHEKSSKKEMAAGIVRDHDDPVYDKVSSNALSTILTEK